MVSYTEDEIIAQKHHKLAVNYSERFLREKGLWEEFIKYAESEDAKRPPIPDLETV